MAHLLLFREFVRFHLIRRPQLILSALLLASTPAPNAHENLIERTRAYSRWKAHWSGPNCHQTTLFAQGYSQAFRYVDTSEFELQVQIRGCAPLADQSGHRIGDLGLFIDVEDGIVHSFTMLDGNRVFSKTGTYSSFPAEVQTFSEMVHWFSMKEKCLTPGMAFSKDCPRVLRYWRCPPLVNSPEAEFTAALATLSEELDQLETWCSDRVRTPDLPKDSEIDGRLQIVAGIRDRLQAHPEGAGDTTTLRLLKARAFSIERQIVMFADPD